MLRMQIYLTERQRDELAAIAKTSEKKQSELIREAVDRLIDQAGRSRREAVLCTRLPESGKTVRIFLTSRQRGPNGTGTNLLGSFIHPSS